LADNFLSNDEHFTLEGLSYKGKNILRQCVLKLFGLKSRWLRDIVAKSWAQPFLFLYCRFDQAPKVWCSYYDQKRENLGFFVDSTQEI